MTEQADKAASSSSARSARWNRPLSATTLAAQGTASAASRVSGSAAAAILAASTALSGGHSRVLTSPGYRCLGQHE
ncbi:MAG: hypothetical protein ACRDRV_21555 [Pseudonocardiaceae bacterium]